MQLRYIDTGDTIELTSNVGQRERLTVYRIDRDTQTEGMENVSGLALEDESGQLHWFSRAALVEREATRILKEEENNERLENGNIAEMMVEVGGKEK